MRAICHLRSAILSGIVVICLCAVAPQPGHAQAPAPTLPPSSNTVTVSRPLYFEIGITVVMCGLALFAVCRNSNRN